MFDSSAIRRDFDAAAQHYDAHAKLQADIRAEAIAIAKSHWAADASILDVGAGTGAFAASATHWQVTSLDSAAGMCTLAASHGPAICASAENLPVADGAFDGVFSCLMLQWSNATVDVLREIKRVLKPGGKAVVVTFVEGTLCELKAAFATVDDASHVSQFHTKETLQSWAQQAGFAPQVMQQELRTQNYASLREVMRSIKVIGARHKQAGRRAALMTPRQFARIETAYSKSDAFPVSWQVLYMVLEKPL